MCQLVNKFNEIFGYSIIISFALNLYDVCVKTLTVMRWAGKIKYSIFHQQCIKLYILYSYSSLTALDSISQNLPVIITLGVSLVCFLLVSYFASQVHETSMMTSQILMKINESDYPLELIQFRNYLTSARISISGRGFFSVTKGMLLSVSRH